MEFVKVLLSALAVNNGKRQALGKKINSNLINVNIKLPKHNAEIVANCVACFAKRGNIEDLFDEFCTEVFLLGIEAWIIKEFKNFDNQFEFVVKIAEGNSNCGKCKLLNYENPATP